MGPRPVSLVVPSDGDGVQVIGGRSGAGQRHHAFRAWHNAADPHQPVTAGSHQRLAGLGEKPVRVPLSHDQLADIPNRSQDLVEMLDVEFRLFSLGDVHHDCADGVRAPIRSRNWKERLHPILLDARLARRFTAHLYVQNRFAGGQHLLKYWLDCRGNLGTTSGQSCQDVRSTGTPFISANVSLIWRYRRSLSNSASPAVAPAKKRIQLLFPQQHLAFEPSCAP